MGAPAAISPQAARSPADGAGDADYRRVPVPAKRPRPVTPVVYRLPEAAAALAMSVDHFNRHVRPTLRVIHNGTLTLFPVAELEKWADDQAQMELGGGPGGR